jgi:L-lactate dehydrogenase complex protein LldG
MRSSKEAILSNIKRSLSKKGDDTLVKPDFHSPIYTRRPIDDRLLFAENFTARKGTFYFSDSQTECINQLTEFLMYKNVKNIFVWEQALLEFLKGSALKFSTTDQDFDKVEVGISLCECLVARTGSILLTSQQAAGRRLSIYPPMHVVVAFVSQLLYDVSDALTFMQKKYVGRPPSMISLVTGASRTADIEKTLVMGAHGPKELALFLVDDVGL